MTNYEILALVLSSGTILLGITSFLNSKNINQLNIEYNNKILEIEKQNLKHNTEHNNEILEINKKILKIEEQNLKYNIAQTELYIQELLVNARKLLLDILLESSKNNNIEFNKRFINSGLQEVLNSYEVACSKYLDNKIEKERFKKTYRQEITKLFESSNFEDLLSKTNSYLALKKVNDQWNNLE